MEQSGRTSGGREPEPESTTRGSEHEPLLSSLSRSKYYTEGQVDEEQGECSTRSNHGVSDNMMYRTRNLTSWEAFQIRYQTIWFSVELWGMMARLGAVAVGVAFLTVLIVPDPERMKVAKFTQVSKFLNVVVGLLLGFFLTSSMNRWYLCVNGFLELLDAIRNLQMQLEALGVPEAQVILCLRYGVASALLLHGQLLIDAKTLEHHHSVILAEREKLWEMLTSTPAKIDRSGCTMLLRQSEADALRTTRDPPGMMWMWVASLIGRIAQDGWIPPMASPTYGRIMNLCQAAHSGIRQVRASISVQAPLTYTHMLATLVHINNLLNAITFGVVSGLAIGVSLMAAGFLKKLPYHTKREISENGEEIHQDWQNMAVTFLYCFFGPLLYQALLLISMHLAQPFDAEDTNIPLDRLLHQLEVDMCDGRDILRKMPQACGFDNPYFKQPPADA